MKIRWPVRSTTGAGANGGLTSPDWVTFAAAWPADAEREREGDGRKPARLALQCNEGGTASCHDTANAAGMPIHRNPLS